MSRDVNKFGTLPFNSALYQSATVSRWNEEIESCRIGECSLNRLFTMLRSFFFHCIFFNRLSKSPSIFTFANSRFRVPRKLFPTKRQTWLILSGVFLWSASRLHLVWSHRKITPSKVRTVHKLSEKFGEMDRTTENLVGFGDSDWWNVVKKGYFSEGKGLARVSKSSLHDQTYGLSFIFFLSLVILIFVSSFSFCSFVFVHPPSLFPIRLLLILLHPKYCENVTIYCK